MTNRTGRNEKWQQWNDNRQPPQDTPRRETQIRDRQRLRELDEDLRRRTA